MKKILLLLLSIAFYTVAAEKSLLELQEGDSFFGNKNASITMITYDSLSCPHCAQFNVDVMPALKKLFENDVLFIHRDFPIDTPSLYGSLLLSCLDVRRAGQIRFLLFQSQPKWIFTRKKENLLENIYNIVQISGITRVEYDKCMNDMDLKNKLVLEKDRAIKEIGVFATPTHFINGKKYEGAHPVEFFGEIFEEIKKQQQSIK